MPLTKQHARKSALYVTVVVAAQLHAVAQTADRTGDANRETQPEAVTRPEPGVSIYIPQTQKERLHYYFKHMFSFESVVRSAAGSGINQALDIPHEWGQGAEGYGRRFASSYGNHIVQATVMYGTSAVLHEDNRYFRSGLTGTGPRLKYALRSSFMARHDDGSMHFSISRIGSYAAAAAISRAWQPPSTIGPLHAVDSYAIAVGVEVGFNVAREFVPFLHSLSPVAENQNSAH